MTFSALRAHFSGAHAEGSGAGSRKHSATKRGDIIDWLMHAVYTVQPYSWQALAIAVAGLVLATGMRAAFGLVAALFPLTFYFLCILGVELLAGLPAAVLTSIASVTIAWWAFTEPVFQVAPPNTHDLALLILLGTECGLAILFGYWCKVALLRLHRHQMAYRTVARELAHRNKNTLTVVEAIVRKTLEPDRERADAILGRLQALARANDLLTSAAGVQLDALLAAEFVPYGTDRLLASGPQVDLPAETARHLSLILHELVTNAVKYGALSCGDGRVIVRWTTKGRDLVMKWKEQGGPPADPPRHKGFGSVLMSHSASALAGRFKPRFTDRGFACELAFPLSRTA